MPELIVSTDGGCRGNGQPNSYGSWGFIVYNIDNSKIHSGSGCKAPTTNNEMELSGFLNAIKWIIDIGNNGNTYKFVMDSSYVFNSITKGWVYNWAERSFIMSGSKYRPNWELWSETVQVLEKLKKEGIDIELTWVEGHATSQHNNDVDLLCNQAMDAFKATAPANVTNTSNTSKLVKMSKLDEDELLSSLNINSDNFINVDDSVEIGMISESELTSDQKNAIGKIVNWYKNDTAVSQVFTVGGYAGCGKCLHEDSLLVYEDGYHKIKDVQVGDKIYASDGTLCSVVHVFPQLEKKVCYDVVFNDGTELVCDDEQLFAYHVGNYDAELQTETLKTIFERHTRTNKDKKIQIDDKILVPLTKALRFKNNQVSLESQFVGLLLSPYCYDFYFNEGGYFVMHLSKLALSNDNLMDSIIEMMKPFNYVLSGKNLHKEIL